MSDNNSPKNSPKKSPKNPPNSPASLKQSDKEYEKKQEEMFESESEYEEIDLTENSLYQVLSTILEDSEGNNLCECINKLRETMEFQNKLVFDLLSKLADK